MKAGPFAEGLQCLHITVFQNYFMIAVGQIAVIMTKHSFFNMKLRLNLTERLENTGSSSQVTVN
jgi:hypothetical protein